MANELLTKNIKLSYKEGSGSTFTEASNLKSFPDIGSAPEKIEITNLVDSVKRYMNGLADYGDLAFGFYYERGASGNFATLKGLSGDVDWKLTFPDGASFAWKGEPSVTMNGGEPNQAMEFTLNIACSSDFTYTAGTGSYAERVALTK